MIPNDFGFLWLAHYDTAVAGAEGSAARCRTTMNPDRGPNARGLTPAPPLLAAAGQNPKPKRNLAPVLPRAEGQTDSLTRYR